MTSSESKQPKRSLRKRLVNSLKSSSKKEEKHDLSQEAEQPAPPPAASAPANSMTNSSMSSRSGNHDLHGSAVAANGGEHADRHNRDASAAAAVSTSHISSSEDDGDNSDSASNSSKKGKRRGEGFVRRMRSLSRSRSRSKSDAEGERPKTIVTVTSCRSDGYYNQKAPGSTSKLPRKAPTNLKLFHELAVGVKDAYAAVGQTPVKPVMDTNEETGHPNMGEKEFQARNVLWEFIGNIDFVRTTCDADSIRWDGLDRTDYCR